MTRRGAPSRPHRAVVAVLARLLPAGFRDRQRGEWTGDLVELAAGGAGGGWKYLAGAASTVPALRALARSGHLGGAGGGVVASPAALNTGARALALGLGWPVVSWLIVVPVPYLVHALAGLGGPDPQSRWPVESSSPLLAPVWIALFLGPWVAIAGGPFLLASLGLALTLVAPMHRDRSVPRRLLLGVLGLVTVALAYVAARFLAQPGVTFGGTDPGVSVAVLGMTAAALAVRDRRLSRRLRAVLFLVGVTALALALSLNVPATAGMYAWYGD